METLSYYKQRSDELKRLLDQSQAEMEQCHKDRQNFITQINELTNLTTDLTNQGTRKEEILNAATEELVTAKQNLQSVEVQYTTLQAEYDKLYDKYSKVNEIIKQLQEEMVTQDNAITSKDTLLNEANLQIQALTEEIKTLKNQSTRWLGPRSDDQTPQQDPERCLQKSSQQISLPEEKL